jgi:hypothetical protein
MERYIRKIPLFIGSIALCACSVLNNVLVPQISAPTPTLQPLTIQDIIVHHPLLANSQVRDWGLKIYDTSQIGVGFVRPENLNTPPVELPQNDELYLAEGQSLSLYLVLRTGEHAIFLVTVLLDYHQTPFLMDGQRGLLHEVDLESGGDLYVPIQIDIHESGAHDLIILAFKNPYNRPIDHDLRSNEQCLITGRRTVVIAGNDYRPVGIIQPDVVGNAPPSGVDWGPPILFANLGSVHPSQPEGQMNMAAHGNPNQTFAYRVWMSNLGDKTPEPVNYGLVRFMNYHQIDFKGKDLFVVHLDEKQEALLDDKLTLPAQAGVNEVQIIYIYDPYKSLLREEVLAPFVFGSQCLGIQVP